MEKFVQAGLRLLLAHGINWFSHDMSQIYESSLEKRSLESRNLISFQCAYTATHTQPLNSTRDVALCLKHPLVPYIV